MKKLVRMTAIVLCTAAAGCGQPPNPLLGKWKIIARTGDMAKYDTYCPASMLFTSTTQTMTYGDTPATENVTYNAIQTSVYPTTVYVIGTGGHTTYNFPSKDKMILDTAAGCSYQRN